MPPSGKDWNDILRDHPESAEKRFKENQEQYTFNARLALAKTQHEYAIIYREYYDNPAGLFLFNGCTYFSFLRTRGDTQHLIVERVGKFILEVQSFINVGSVDQKEFLYQIKVTPKASRPVICTAMGKHLATPKDLKSFLLSHAKVSFEGTASSTQALITKLVDSKTPEVRRALYTGLDPATNWYFFNNWAIDPKGKLHTKGKAGFFDTGSGDMIMSAPQAIDKSIEPKLTPEHGATQLYHLIYKAWGGNGAMALSWVIAGWFVSQIKEKENFFPHISLHGDPAAGKSALTSKLQALQGRNTEGLPLSQLNTKKGLARTMAGLSNVFTALLEDSARNERAFDYSILLTAYNTGSLQVQAKFTNTLETSENPFLSTLMFVQNSEPFNQKAEKQRVISLPFKAEDLNANTRQAFNELNSYPKEELASFMMQVLQHRKAIEREWFDEYRAACADLENISEERIKNNHGLILGFHNLFCKLFSIESDIFKHVEKVALAKENSSVELEINDASTFFRQVHEVESKQTKYYWQEVETSGGNQANINSVFFRVDQLLRLLQNSGMPAPRMENLEMALRNHPAYLRHSARYRFPKPNSNFEKEQKRAYQFDLIKLREVEGLLDQVE